MKHQSSKTILCEDGSYTMYSEEFKEPYHSTKDGALHESLQKYVIPTMSLKSHRKKITILDICYGLGYNVLSTIYYMQSKDIKTKVHFISVEFDRDLVKSLVNLYYPKEFEKLKHIISSISHTNKYEDEQFSIEVIIADARIAIPKISKKVDIIYQDPFSPANNSLLWTTDYFADLRKLSKNDTILATYSTAASIRLGLYENGFQIHLIQHKLARSSTIASPTRLASLEYIDMELKKQRNPISKSLKDKECQLKM